MFYISRNKDLYVNLDRDYLFARHSVQFASVKDRYSQMVKEIGFAGAECTYLSQDRKQ
jgi:hypothetical protein